MPVDPDDLAVLALRRADARSEDHDGNALEGTAVLLDPGERAHLASLRRVVDVGRAVRADDRDLVAPPPDLWSGITAEALGPDVRTAPGGVVADLDAHRRNRRGGWLAAAAAVVLLLGAVGVWMAGTAGQDRDELVASADLSLLAGGGSGTAELRERDDGLHLVVDVAGLSPAQQADFYELWLLTPEGGDPHSMLKFDERDGLLDAPIPEGMDPAEFPVVDISEEIDDGDESHSGLSILRGSFS